MEGYEKESGWNLVRQGVWRTPLSVDLGGGGGVEVGVYEKE